MAAPNFRQVEYRSRAYLDGARGATCKLRFVGICNGNPETTVACHVHDGSFGMARKAHDFNIIDGCSDCHMFLDHGWVGKISAEERLRYIVRGLQETLFNRIERGIMAPPLDRGKRRQDTPTKPRKPAAERAEIHSNRAIPNRPFPAGSRPLQSRNDLAKSERQPHRSR